MKLTPKQEAFARKYVESSCASTAYRFAYDAKRMKDNVIHVKACELLKDGKVSVRVQQLQERHQKRNDITVEKLTEMAVEAYKLAMKDDVQTPSAAVSAVMALGKLHGLIIDKAKTESEVKSQVTYNIETGVPRHLDEDEDRPPRNH